MKPADTEKDYEDMICLPHHTSQDRPHMPLSDRAAQFAPFAALTGYGDVIKETARPTWEKPELTEDEKEVLNARLKLACGASGEKPQIDIVWFVPDERKAGGVCRSISGTVKRVDMDRREIVLEKGERIGLESVIDIVLTEKGENEKEEIHSKSRGVPEIQRVDEI